jgi:hypothetical protein
VPGELAQEVSEGLLSRKVLGAVRAHQQQAGLRDDLHSVAQQGHGVPIRPVQVVQHLQARPPAGGQQQHAGDGLVQPEAGPVVR